MAELQRPEAMPERQPGGLRELEGGGGTTAGYAASVIMGRVAVPCRLSVVIPTWNGRGRLLALVDDLAAARAAGLDLEALVVDDASRDGTPAAVALRQPWVRLLVNRENLGFARTAGRGAAAATGTLVLLLNDDVRAPAGALAALCDALEARPDAVAAAPALADEGGRPQRVVSGPLTLGALLHRVQLVRWTGLARAAHARFRRPALPVQTAPVACLSGAALLVRREHLAACPLDPGYPFGLEDADLCARLGRRGALLFVPGVQLVHVGGVASEAAFARVQRGYEAGWLRYAARHLGRRAATLYALAVVLDGPARVSGALLRLGAAALRGRGVAAAWRRAGVTLSLATVEWAATWRAARAVTRDPVGRLP